MSDLAKAIARAIESDLKDRRGLRHTWEEIDPKAIREIRSTWVKLIQAELDLAIDTMHPRPRRTK